MVENHEGALALREDPFQEFQSESTQAVFVGNHNFFDTSLEYGVQNGRKTGPSPVEPASDVGDKFMVWATSLEVVDLSLQVLSLMFGRNAGIADASAMLVLLLLLLLLVSVEERVDIDECVEVHASWCCNGAYATVSTSSEHGTSADIVDGCNF